MRTAWTYCETVKHAKRTKKITETTSLVGSYHVLTAHTLRPASRSSYSFRHFFLFLNKVFDLDIVYNSVTKYLQSRLHHMLNMIFSHMRTPTGSLVLDRSIRDGDLARGIHSLLYESQQSDATLIVGIVPLRI